MITQSDTDDKSETPGPDDDQDRPTDAEVARWSRRLAELDDSPPEPVRATCGVPWPREEVGREIPRYGYE